MKRLFIDRWSKYSDQPERSRNVRLHLEDGGIATMMIIEKEKGNEDAGYLTDAALHVKNVEASYDGSLVRVNELENASSITASFGGSTVFMSREQAVELTIKLTEIL
jgi:hypothetical protein